MSGYGSPAGQLVGIAEGNVCRMRGAAAIVDGIVIGRIRGQAGFRNMFALPGRFVFKTRFRESIAPDTAGGPASGIA
jgi:hypothetical protein